MPDPLRGVRLKIERAKQHILDLNAASQSFMNPGSDAFTYTDDADTGKRVYHLRVDPVIPDAIPVVIGDAIQNLRTGLDHLAYSLCLAGPKRDRAPKLGKLYFPIGIDAHEFPNRRDGCIQGMWPTEAVDVLNRIEPYGGGKGDILYTLHLLNLTDKHRLLLAVAGQTRSVDLGSYMFQDLRRAMPPEKASRLANVDMSVFYRPADRPCPVKAGEPFLIEPSDREPYKDFKARLDVAIYEPQILKCQPVLPLLQNMADFIERVVVPGLARFA